VPLRVLLISAILAATISVPAQVVGEGPRRPPIMGVAHIGLRTSDLAAADNFYGHVLGFDHFSLDKPEGGLMLNYYKVNDHQYIEIYPTLRDPNEDRMTHFAFETTDVEDLRKFLAARGVKVPASLKPGLDGNLSMMVKDPEGHDVEFVQYMPGSLHSRYFNKLMPETRISRRMIHVGVTIKDVEAANHFYHDILGFNEFWHGGMTNDRTQWVDMRVSDGTDWLEFMLINQNPNPKQLGVLHHLALGIQKIDPAYQQILSRGYKPPEPPKIGRDGKWQLNLYDPDHTRAELMEFKPTQTPCCAPMTQ
jgi:catechol 2,3-dioxygenase-like lactoylglutathione lyase family enzyme